MEKLVFILSDDELNFNKNIKGFKMRKSKS